MQHSLLDSPRLFVGFPNAGGSALGDNSRNNFYNGPESQCLSPTAWLDVAGNHARLSSTGGPFEDDCAFVLAAQFPWAGQGLGSARAAGTDAGCTTSADILNAHGRAGDVMTGVTEDAGALGAGLDVEEAPQTATTLCQKGSKPTKANTGKAHRGGRRPAPKKNARGGSRAGASTGPTPLIFKGTIGGTANVQALSMPWSMSLQLLNHQLAATDEAVPDTDS